MAISTDVCIRRVADAAHLTDTEAEALLDRVRRHRDEMSDQMDFSKLGPEIEIFFQREGYELEQDAIQQRRKQLIGLKRSAEFRAAYTQRAINNGLPKHKAIWEEVHSIEPQTAANENKYLSRFIKATDDDRILSELLASKDKSFDEELMKELHKPGTTQDERAKKIAALTDDTFERIRQDLNDAGANIRKLESFGIVHRHNRPAIINKPMEWERTLLDTVDWEKTLGVPGASGPPPGTVEAIRSHILKGTELVLDPVPVNRRRGRQAARPLEHERILHFKDADGWMQYNRKFGQGGAFDGILNHIRYSSLRLAQMQKLGPNPEATLTSVLEFEKNQLRKINPGSEIEDYKALTELERNDVARGYGPIGRAWLSVSNVDSIPENPNLARFMSGTRKLIGMAKLGKALLSQFSDIPIAVMQTKVKFGYSLFDAWGQTLRAVFLRIPPEVRQEFAGLIDVFGDGVRRRLGARLDGMTEYDHPGKLSRMSEFFYRVNGMTFWTDNFKAGVADMMSHALGRNAGKSFSELGPEMAFLLKNYGLDRHWDVIRAHMAWTDSQGRAYLVPEKAKDIPDQVIDGLIADRVQQLQASSQAGGFSLAPAVDKMKREARDEIEIALHTLFAAEVDSIVVTPDSKTRNITTWGGMKAGTAWGELARTVMQFKSFMIAFHQKVLMPIVVGRPGQSMGSRMSNLALLIAQTTAFGYVSMNMKRIANGELPTWENEDNNIFSTGLAAMVQGGGAGLYGDFLLGERNRFGSSPIETLAGPTIGGPVNDALRLWGLFVNPDERLRAADFLNVGINNAPYINLFYTRAALDYAVLYSAREALSPGWLRRREQNMRRDGGREYFLPPTRYRLRPFE